MNNCFLFFLQTNQNELQILVAIVRYKTKLVKPRVGVCSAYLADLAPSIGIFRIFY